MKLEKILDDFADLLSERFSLNKMTTEDTVRYLFFYALNQNGISHNDIVLEYDHPDISPKKIDSLIENFEETSLVLEFKFHREGKSQDPRTMNAGEIFYDFFKLKKLTTDERRLVVYVTDQMMRNYFQNRNDILQKWYDLTSGETIELSEGEFLELPKTFLDACKNPTNVKIKSITSKNINKKYTLKVFELLT